MRYGAPCELYLEQRTQLTAKVFGSDGELRLRRETLCHSINLMLKLSPKTGKSRFISNVSLAFKIRALHSSSNVRFRRSFNL